MSSSIPPRRSRPPRYSIDLPSETRMLDAASPEQTLPARGVHGVGGSIHYFHHSERALRVLLEKAKSWRLDYIETYVPWRAHETTPGAFDFSTSRGLGTLSLPQKESDERAGLSYFLANCTELGLRVLLRPGPHCNAELSYFGLPERILNDPACRARGAEGSHVLQYWPPVMFAVPSYASEVFLSEATRWLTAVRDCVAPYLENGVIAAVQIDNEGAYYFRDGVFEQDYHPDALRVFEAFLRERYSDDTARISRAYTRDVRSFAQVDAPRENAAKQPNELVPLLDWALFQDWLYLRAWRIFAGVFSAFQHVPLTTNLPLGERSSTLPVAEFNREKAVVGLDLYHRRSEFAAIRDRVLFAVGSATRAFGSEVGVGAPFWWKTLTFDDALFTLQTSIAYGLDGINMYMFADRDRWHGGVHDVHGTAHPEAFRLRDWLDILRSTGWPWAGAYTRNTPVALVLPRGYLRLRRIANAFGALSPVALEAVSGVANLGVSATRYGYEDAIQIEAYRWLAEAQRLLEEAQIPYVWIDGDALETRGFGFQLVLAPTFEFLDERTFSALRILEQRGADVLTGPHTPHRNDRGEMLGESVFRESPRRKDDLKVALQRLWSKDPERYRVPKSGDARCAVVEWVREEDVVLFMINHSHDLVQTRVVLPYRVAQNGARVEKGTASAFQLEPGGESIALLLRPHEVQVTRLRKDRG